MNKDQVLKRLTAALICLLIINTTMSAFPPHPWAAAACAAEESSPVPEGPSIYSGQEGNRPVRRATPSDSDGREEEEIFLVDDLATASDATPSNATPSNASNCIVFVDVPSVAALAAGEADYDTWEDHLPRQAFARTRSDQTLWCGLQWSVSCTNWDLPGVYPAQIEVIPPDGYMMAEPNTFYDAVISIHPPGTSQVMEVFTSMRYGMKGHTWTFAMKAGQDMTPLVEALERITIFNGILDDPVDNITFFADWDFSSVDPDRPGIYPIHRSLTLMEDSLPEGISAEDIYLPDYWKDLPVLFSVEAPGGPQLSGVLENPYDFFGSYAKLPEEELKALKIWYSINGSGWVLQTDEGLMDADEKNFYIHKDAMEEGSSYSFRLELGDYISRELTVLKDQTSPVWFTSMMDGNRDGTIDVDFPSISQPPPADPTEEETPPRPTQPTEEETSPPPTKPTGEETHPQPTPPAGKETRPDSGISDNDGWTGSGELHVTIPADVSESSVLPDSEAGSFPIPWEEITRWSSQISGKRVRKLIEVYPDWILFQKEEVSILLSSQWLRDQQMKDSDVLTVSVSPDEDHAVTILINQKTTQSPPICQITVGETKKDRFDGAAAKTILTLAMTGAMAALLWKRRR